MGRATFRFYQELNDFLPLDRRGAQDVPFSFVVPPTVKDAIESLGVPHVEVDLIVVDGQSVDFDRRLHDGDRVAVYPVFEGIDLSPIVCLRPAPLRRTAFIADVHLRKLARLLRLLGFDTVHSNDYGDAEIAARSLEEGRTILTRDRQLLKRGTVTHGYWVRSVDPVEQAREVVRRFDLARNVEPLTRCPVCNGALRPVEKAAVLDRIPPKTAAWLDEYRECESCGKLYWHGTHAERLESLVDRICAVEESREASPGGTRH